MDYKNKDLILQSIEKDLPLEHINVIDAHGHNGGKSCENQTAHVRAIQNTSSVMPVLSRRRFRLERDGSQKEVHA